MVRVGSGAGARRRAGLRRVSRRRGPRILCDGAQHGERRAPAEQRAGRGDEDHPPSAGPAAKPRLMASRTRVKARVLFSGFA